MIKQCSVCKTEFTDESPAKNRKFCSDECREKAKQEKVEMKDEIKTEVKPEEILLSEERKMKAYLDSCPKISFMCPLVLGEEEGAYETVCLNGYIMQIKKGVLLELPKPVVEILANKYRVEIEAGKEIRADRSEEVEKTLS